jgi:hypothetical protein
MIVFKPNGNYIGYMRKTLDYTITIMSLTIIPLTVKCTLCILIHHSPLRCVRFIDQKRLIWILQLFSN